MATPEPTIAIVGGAGGLATEALSWMLTSSGNRVAGVYADVAGLASASGAGKLNLQAAIVDGDDPTAGPAAVARLRRCQPELKIMLLCEWASPALVRCAIDEHAEGLVLKSDGVREVILALRHVLAGRSVMPVGWHGAWLEPEPDDPLAALTAREQEVLALAACGLSNKEIATQLVISANTVKFHLRTIYSRLGVRNRVQATQILNEQQQDEQPHEPSQPADEHLLDRGGVPAHPFSRG